MIPALEPINSWSPAAIFLGFFIYNSQDPLFDDIRRWWPCCTWVLAFIGDHERYGFGSVRCGFDALEFRRPVATSDDDQRDICAWTAICIDVGAVAGFRGDGFASQESGDLDFGDVGRCAGVDDYVSPPC